MSCVHTRRAVLCHNALARDTRGTVQRRRALPRVRGHTARLVKGHVTGTVAKHYSSDQSIAIQGSCPCPCHDHGHMCTIVCVCTTRSYNRYRGVSTSDQAHVLNCKILHVRAKNAPQHYEVRVVLIHTRMPRPPPHSRIHICNMMQVLRYAYMDTCTSPRCSHHTPITTITLHLTRDTYAPAAHRSTAAATRPRGMAVARTGITVYIPLHS